MGSVSTDRTDPYLVASPQVQHKASASCSPAPQYVYHIFGRHQVATCLVDIVCLVDIGHFREDNVTNSEKRLTKDKQGK